MKNMEELYQAISNNKADNLTLLDVRTPEEFNEGHIEKAINIPHDQITETEIVKLRDHNKLVVFCRMGGRASFAGQILAASGLDPVIIDENGMAYWYEQNYPVI